MTTDIPAGYKLTEVGVIPGDWSVVSVANITNHVGDGLHGTPTYSSTGKYFFINGNNLTDGKLTVSSETKKVDYSEYLKHRKPLNDRSILISINGTIGNLGLFDGEPVVLGKSAAYLNVKPEISKNFVYYSLQTKMVQHQFLDGLTGSTIGNLGLTTLRKTQICLPSTNREQRVIAATLSDVDALLAKLDALIAKKRDLKQATMQQLLTGQIRLPGFRGEWEFKRMKSLGNTYGGLTGKTKIDFGHGLARYIPFMNVMTSTVIDAEWLEAVDIPSNDAQNLTQKGDLFFNGSSETPEEVGFCSVLLQEIPNLYLNSFCFGFRFNADAKVNGLFFAYWFRSDKGRETMAVLAQGATRYNIAKSAFLRLELPQPTQAEQTAIATVLSDMDAELAALQARRDKTHALKQGMMQTLLTGRIRLV